MTTALDYNIGYLIGSGADGEVRTASLSDGKQFAVKILKVKDDDQRERYRREIDVIKFLNHDNIVKFHDIKEGEDTIYLFMQHIKGKNLEAFMSDHEEGIDEEIVKGYFYQLLNAVHFIHAQGISHRDLKLENLMIDDNGRIYLIDFGLCGVATESSPLFRDPVGSPLYVCPQKLQNQPYCGKMSDVWSLGVCLYKLLNGFFPFYPYDTGSQSELAELVQNTEAYMNPKLSPLANDLLSKMLEKDPERRLTVPQMLDHPWFN